MSNENTSNSIGPSSNDESLQKDVSDIPNFDYFSIPIVKHKMKENYDELIKDINRPNIPNYLETKIIKRINRYNLVETMGQPMVNLFDKIVKKIKSDSLYAYEFMKDPSKQNIWENLQLKYINSYRNANVVKLSSLGINAYYLVDGELVSNKGKKPKNGTKSLDFLSGNTFVYAKRTGVTGGSQDNQCDDACKFICEANSFCNKYPNSDKRFILLIDGPYYTISKRKDIEDNIDKENKNNIRVYSSDTYKPF